MKGEEFKLKQFVVAHGRSSMKVGTDAILLAGCVADSNLINSSLVSKVLDIGCGCGILSLAMAQFFPSASVVGIDIDEDSVNETMGNFRQSRWCNRLKANKISLQEYQLHDGNAFDLIVSNPPFFENSLTSSSSVRTNARHTVALSIDELAFGVNRLLSSDGLFYCVLPLQTSVNLKLAFVEYSICCVNEVCVFSFENDKTAIRSILAFKKKLTCKNFENRYIYEEPNKHSQWYKWITRDLLL